MHLFLVILVPTNRPVSVELVEQVMRPFDRNQGSPRRLYLGAEAINLMARQYGLPADNLVNLADRVVDWMGAPGGVDEKGLYWIDQTFPGGKWRSWQIGGRWNGYLLGTGIKPYSFAPGVEEEGQHNLLEQNMAPASTVLETDSIHAVLTPSGNWYEANAEERYLGHWQSRMRFLLKQYSACNAVGVDCTR